MHFYNILTVGQFSRKLSHIFKGVYLYNTIFKICGTQTKIEGYFNHFIVLRFGANMYTTIKTGKTVYIHRGGYNSLVSGGKIPDQLWWYAETKLELMQ